MSSSATIQPRLDPDGSQRAFDVLLRSLAEPGTIHRFDADVLAPGVPAVALIALALADVDVTLNVDGEIGHPLAETLAATTGASPAEVETADLVMLTAADGEVLGRCAVGSALEPEAGARLAVRVEAIRRDPEPGDDVVTLDGPGVPGTRTIAVSGVGSRFLNLLAATNRDFPAGVDTWFVTDAGDVVALSRSTRHSVREPSPADRTDTTRTPEKET